VGATVVLQPHGLRIPALSDLADFRAWIRSDEFPEAGRIDWIGGELEVDMSPEDVNTHGTPKVAIAVGLSKIIQETGRGVVLVDATRYTSRDADLSCEPDVIVLLFASLDAGRVRLLPKATGEPGRYVEVEGAADLVVECVSDSSVPKDTTRLPQRYFRAGVREHWLVDARGLEPQFRVSHRGSTGWVEVTVGADGFTESVVAQAAVRLVRLPVRSGVILHSLETRPLS
jgi:Uma2 family endonuclease